MAAPKFPLAVIKDCSLSTLDPSLLEELRLLGQRVDREWRPLPAAEKASLWAQGAPERFLASENASDSNLRDRWAAASLAFAAKPFPGSTEEAILTLRQLNGHILGASASSPFRNYDLENEVIAFTPAHEIAEALEDVWQKSQAEPEPCVRAALLGQELLSVHPFEDGNGRTVRLFVDLYLQAEDYPPPRFESPLDFFMANSWRGPAQFSREHAVLLIGSAITRRLDSLAKPTKAG